MNDKEFYDEKDFINSLVDETPTVGSHHTKESKDFHFNGAGVTIKHTHCGCFDLRKFCINFWIYAAALFLVNQLVSSIYLSNFIHSINSLSLGLL